MQGREARADLGTEDQDSPVEASAVARWDAAFERYRAYNDRIHAVITWIEGSRRDAEAADQRRQAGASIGRLDGMLVGLKDNIDTAGILTSAGARFLTDNIPSSDATVVRLLRAQGAVIVAKLNMAELAFGATTQNATFGSCRNPWDTSRIPGGSSGGSGAALAAGFCEAALGTDTGASVRVPSSVNGVVGIRPTVGAISTDGVYPVAYTQDTVGPMAHRALDVARLAETLICHDPQDPYSVSFLGRPATALIGRPLQEVRVGIGRRFFFDDIESGVGGLVESFLSWLTSETSSAREVSVAGARDTYEHWTRIVQCEAAAFHYSRVTQRPEDFSPDVGGRISGGLGVPATDLARSLDFRARYRRNLADLFTHFDVIVTPVVGVDVPEIVGDDSRAQTAALGRITYPWAMHDGPTMTLPIGFHPLSGLPVGIALSAARFDESRLFQIACAYQQVTDWHLRKPELA